MEQAGQLGALDADIGSEGMHGDTVSPYRARDPVSERDGERELAFLNELRNLPRRNDGDDQTIVPLLALDLLARGP
jgi:hypothetical protein